MADENELKSALDRLVQSIATDDDHRAVQQAMLAGNIVYSAGERTVSVAGDAMGTIIITGDNNQIKLDISEAIYKHMQTQIFPTPSGMPPPFPGLIFIGREQALHNVKSLLGVN